MAKDLNELKKQLTPAQLQQLMQMQQMMAGQRKASKAIKIVNAIVQKMQLLQHALDRFINFIIKSEDKKRNDVIQSARAPILFGTYVTFVFVVIGGIWMSFAPLDSATVAVGTVISSSNKQVVQSAESGVIKNIFVKQGDLVKKNDQLIELDDVRVKADYENILHQYRIAIATEARLIAERDTLEKIEFPPFLMNDIHILEVDKIVHTQENLFKYKKEHYRTHKESLKHKIKQVEKKIEALEEQKIAIKKNLEVVNDRLKGLKSLSGKGVVAKTTVLEQEARQADLKGKFATAEAEIEQTKQELTRVQMEDINTENEHLSKILSELKDAHANRGVLQEKFNSINFSLEKIIVRSPVDGIVNNLNIHTIGGVVQAGQQLLEISPSNDNLIIEVNVPHRNIDSVKVGLVAKISFSAFKSRTTPLFTGKLVSLSPDIIQIRNPYGQGENYYVGKIEIDMDEFHRLTRNTKLQLHPGMQAEVKIITGERTLLKYLLAPLTDTMFRAFNEK